MFACCELIVCLPLRHGLRRPVKKYIVNSLQGKSGIKRGTTFSMLTPQTTRELQELVEADYGVRITAQNANEIAKSLAWYFELLLQANPQDRP